MMDNEPPPPYPRANSNYNVPTPYNTGLGGGFGMAAPPGHNGMGAIVPFNSPPVAPNPYTSPPLGPPNPYTSPPLGIQSLFITIYPIRYWPI
jgi:hypothetical protein